MSALDNDLFASSSMKATPLQIERAKNATLQDQLKQCISEKEKLQHLLKQTQADHETHLLQTKRLQKIQANKLSKLNDTKGEIKEKDDVDVKKHLELTLASCQNDFVNEIATSKRLREQCKILRQQKEESVNVEQKEGDNDKVARRLTSQRDELLLLVKKQMQLIELLKQQRVHVEAASLLRITEKEFLKEVKCR